MANKNHFRQQPCQVAYTAMSQKLTPSQQKVKPIWVKKKGGLGVKSHENPDDGAVSV